MKKTLSFIRKWISRLFRPGDDIYLEESPDSSLDTQSDAIAQQEANWALDNRIEGASLAPSPLGSKHREKRQKEHTYHPWSLKRRVIVSSLCAFAILMLGAGAYAYSILHDPMGQFDNIAQQFSAPMYTDQEVWTPPADVSDDAVQTTESLIPTPNEYDNLVKSADFSLLKNIVNVLLIGVDHAEERDTWSGKKAFHADVMIVLAINTETGTVDMISLPRDTYAKIPGVKGIYKLNASIDCGGGWPSESNNYSTAGFNKVCEAASWMLGDIPVQYYYAVDMNAVKGLVNTIGGVDFDVDIDYTIQGRSYIKGMQHLDGQGVLDYLRVRKDLGDESGDKHRIDRQKRMLVAIFEKLKAEGMLAKLPGILGAFDGNLYTNTTLAQTAGLAAYAYNVDPANIRIHSMGGQTRLIFNWSFMLTDQQARVDLIKQVYGVDVPIYKDYTASAAISKWNSMQGGLVRSGAKSVLSKVKAKLDADAKLPVYGEATPTPVPTHTTEPTAPPVSEPPESSAPVESSAPPESSEPVESSAPPESSAPSEAALSEVSFGMSSELLITDLNCSGGNRGFILLRTGAPAGYQQYGDTERSFYNHVRGEVGSASPDHLKADVEKLCSMFNVGVPNWRVNWEGSNEIDVDFR
jgi:LCP family protein required for cell wall assembly